PARPERKYGKNELLDRYLNQVYFGEGSYGLAAAAGTEFGTDPSRLTVAQAATLAAQIRGPSRLDPRRHPRGVLLRRDAVLRNMRRNGWIGDGQLRRALAEPLHLPPPPPPRSVSAPHFVSYVEREAGSIDALGGSPE